jgi:hypothetical protein
MGPRLILPAFYENGRGKKKKKKKKRRKRSPALYSIGICADEPKDK